MTSFLINPYRFGASLHPDVSNWLARVTTNGGSASTATVQALETFCVAIDAQAGLRAAITRLNLFCGDQLAAALVPLYVAESAGATAKGSATDTNNGFTSGDYAASGASGGLTGNGSTKYLNTGLLPSQFGSGTSGHLSASGTGYSTTIANVALGSYNNIEAGLDDLIMQVDFGGTAGIVAANRFGSFASGPRTTPAANWAHLIGSTTSATSRVLYSAGSAINTQTSSITASRNATIPYFVFAINNNGTAAAHTSSRQRMYSIGSGLTAAQAAAFSAAVAAFNTALSR